MSRKRSRKREVLHHRATENTEGMPGIHESLALPSVPAPVQKPAKRLMVLPIFTDPETGAYTVPDFMLAGVFDQIVLDGKAPYLFWGGNITNPYDFIQFIRNPAFVACFVIDVADPKVVFLAWLSDFMGDGAAFGHFCSIGPYRRGSGEIVLEFWKNLGLQVVAGITPETFEGAIHLLKHLGFRTLAEPVPKICGLAAEGKRVGARISYFEF